MISILDVLKYLLRMVFHFSYKYLKTFLAILKKLRHVQKWMNKTTLIFFPRTALNGNCNNLVFMLACNKLSQHYNEAYPSWCTIKSFAKQKWRLFYVHWILRAMYLVMFCSFDLDKMNCYLSFLFKNKFLSGHICTVGWAMI